MLTNSDIEAARRACLVKWPYLRRAVNQLMPKASRKVVVNGLPTMGVDERYNLYYHPDMDLPLSQISTLIAHEAMHLVLQHADRTREGGYDHMLANIGGDLEINDDLLADGADLPEWAIHPQRYGLPTGLTMEHYIYRWRDLQKQNQQNQNQEEQQEQNREDDEQQEDEQDRPDQTDQTDDTDDADDTDDTDDTDRDESDDSESEDSGDSESDSADSPEMGDDGEGENELDDSGDDADSDTGDSDDTGGDSADDDSDIPGESHDGVDQDGTDDAADDSSPGGDGDGESSADGDGTDGPGGSSASDVPQDVADQTDQTDDQTGDGQPGDTDGMFGGSCADGVPRDWEDEPDGLSELEQRVIAEQVVQEAVTAEQDLDRRSIAGYGRGNQPGSVLRTLTLRRVYKQPKWQHHLRSVIGQAIAYKSGSADYSYRRMSRRGQSVPDVVLPGMVKHNPIIAVVTDVSGSMDPVKLARANEEVAAACHFGTAYCLPCDTQVTGVIKIDSHFSARSVRINGMGGTDMMAGIQWAFGPEFTKQTGKRPDVVLVVTDADTWWDYEYRPPKPVVVVCILDHRYNNPEQDSYYARVPGWAKKVAVMP